MLNGIDILIVEDSSSQAMLLKGLLETHGCEVRVASNGREALEHVAERAPTLIVSDVVMPEMDGYELCRILKQNPATHDIPIILVTNLSDARDVVRGLACGADNFILKPYDDKYLISRIRYFLANLEVRQHGRFNLGVEVVLGGERHFITAARQQILDLLISTYEQGIQLNTQLRSKHVELTQSHRLLDTLFHFSAGLTDQQSEAEVIDKALTSLLGFPGCSGAWLLLDAGDGYRCAGARGIVRTEQFGDTRACPCVHGSSQDGLANAFNVAECAALGGEGLHACIPLRLGNELLGLLNVVRDDGAVWPDNELATLTSIGQQFAINLARARFFRQLEVLVEERTAALRVEVAERQRAESALRQSEALLVSVLDALPLGVWVTTGKGEVLLHNPEALKIWPDRTPFPLSVKHPPATAAEPTVQRALRHTLKSGEPTINAVAVQDGDRGEPRTLLYSVVPMAQGGRHIHGGIVVAQDITAQRVIDQALRVRDRAIEASVNAIVIADYRLPEQPIIYVNQAFERITGYPRDMAIGRNCRFLQGQDFDQPELAIIRRALETGTEGKAVLRNYRKDGSMFWNELHVAPSLDSQGRITHFVGVLNDITEAKRYQEELEHQANFDTLTGLPNRNLLFDRIHQASVLANRKQERFALAFLDLDNFKYVNDSLGHSVGDMLLIEVAAKLKSCIREFDTLARLGGDEFVLLLPEARTIDEVEGVLQRISDCIVGLIELPGQIEVYASTSIGYCFYPDDGALAEELLRNADTAMYRAKERGKSQVSRFELPMNDVVQRRVSLERELRHALAAGDLEMHYQPQLELQSAMLCGFEALVRWRLDGKPVSPLEFIRLAEETGLIRELDQYVIERVFRQVAQWLAAGYEPGEVAINISTFSLQDYGIVAHIGERLAHYGIPPGRIKLEVTEGLLMKNVELARTIMQELKARGVKWSIDDFGTGYSALGYLRRYPFDQLKIDKMFVDDVHLNPDNASMTRAIIAMARSLGITVIAEGVETVEQLAFLSQAGCEEIQGYYYSPPLPPASCEQLLSKDGMLLPRVVIQPNPHTLLVLDKDLRVHSYLWRALANEGYHILNVDTVEAALNVLAINQVGVLIADPALYAVESPDFLIRVRQLHPEVVRIAMSSYVDIDTVLQAVNEGAVFRYIIKPWAPEQLKTQLREAFHQYQVNHLLRQQGSL